MKATAIAADAALSNSRVLWIVPTAPIVFPPRAPARQKRRIGAHILESREDYLRRDVGFAHKISVSIKLHRYLLKLRCIRFCVEVRTPTEIAREITRSFGVLDCTRCEYLESTFMDVKFRTSGGAIV
jgi:hypothetical protein